MRNPSGRLGQEDKIAFHDPELRQNFLGQNNSRGAAYRCYFELHSGHLIITYVTAILTWQLEWPTSSRARIWNQTTRQELSVSQKKRPPFKRGPSCLGSLALRELYWRPDGGVSRWRWSKASGEGKPLFTAAPSHQWQKRFGGTLLSWPPNCFPSTSHARCWFLPGPASGLHRR
jgi:hypothetical protein